MEGGLVDVFKVSLCRANDDFVKAEAIGIVGQPEEWEEGNGEREARRVRCRGGEGQSPRSIETVPKTPRH